ncbi:succinate dehydrogenase/fumarate reductase flavoprotein subunit [Humitalea rosea]|uniref:Succinate dehydrogenase/fumarate reductase flavoprotein subunit n=1 Tax=Humitalea rosea TaxID=990373 RepID=A0A2W7J1I1_9PROT|nr:FAD-dependent oxidoreductase [Humitalea rosea]PZW44833.1 succinate dehydrogenase/fumarate reductase flavoprotein subunit [Humitalea rosea]
MQDTPSTSLTCDLLVIGSGAGGLSAAITARKAGLDVLVIEKAPVFGGTTAFSGGILWVPGNPHAKARGIADTKEAMRTYLRHEAGNHYREDVVEAFLENGPRMLEFFEAETDVHFIAYDYPDYHPDAPGGISRGRSVATVPYDARELGPELKRLRPPLRTITFLGMMFNSANNDLKHFFNMTRSLASALYVAKRLGLHMTHLARYGRGVQLTSGNALAARLAKSAFDLGIPIHTGTPAKELWVEERRVVGAVVEQDGKPVRIAARRGVILAAGGFARDVTRLTRVYPHVKRGGEHVTPVPEDNTGDGIRMAEAVGARFDDSFPNAAAWMPVSKVPLGDGKIGAFPHLVDRYKPGFIAVNRQGRRFINESHSYHDFGAAMIRTCEGEAETAVWLIAGHRTVRKYGMGFAKPAPMPLALYLRSGYLQRGKTLRELAGKIGVDAATLEATVQHYNEGAVAGEDPEFGRGSTAFNRYLGDADHTPNPNVGPVTPGPYYALKLVMGDLGTFDGIRTDAQARVLDASGAPIPGLYAVGNDMASMMGGAYPGAGITLGPIMTFGYIAGRHVAGLTDEDTGDAPPAAA